MLTILTFSALGCDSGKYDRRGAAGAFTSGPSTTLTALFSAGWTLLLAPLPFVSLPGVSAYDAVEGSARGDALNEAVREGVERDGNSHSDCAGKLGDDTFCLKKASSDVGQSECQQQAQETEALQRRHHKEGYELLQRHQNEMNELLQKHHASAARCAQRESSAAGYEQAKEASPASAENGVRGENSIIDVDGGSVSAPGARATTVTRSAQLQGQGQHKTKEEEAAGLVKDLAKTPRMPEQAVNSIETCRSGLQQCHAYLGQQQEHLTRIEAQRRLARSVRFLQGSFDAGFLPLLPKTRQQLAEKRLDEVEKTVQAYFYEDYPGKPPFFPAVYTIRLQQPNQYPSWIYDITNTGDRSSKKQMHLESDPLSVKNQLTVLQEDGGDLLHKIFAKMCRHKYVLAKEFEIIKQRSGSSNSLRSGSSNSLLPAQTISGIENTWKKALGIETDSSQRFSIIELDDGVAAEGAQEFEKTIRGDDVSSATNEEEEKKFRVDLYYKRTEASPVDVNGVIEELLKDLLAVHSEQVKFEAVCTTTIEQELMKSLFKKPVLEGNEPVPLPYRIINIKFVRAQRGDVEVAAAGEADTTLLEVTQAS